MYMHDDHCLISFINMFHWWGMHPTKRYFRYRLNDPDLYVSFRTIRLGDGVLGVYGSLT